MILDNVDLNDLNVLEWHTWCSDSVGSDYQVILEDSLGKVQLAKHKDSPVYIMQFHPETKRPKEGEVVTNGEVIFDNFLRYV